MSVSSMSGRVGKGSVVGGTTEACGIASSDMALSRTWGRCRETKWVVDALKRRAKSRSVRELAMHEEMRQIGDGRCRV